MTAILSPYGGGGGTSGPWQFTPEQFGAKGNGMMLGDVSITSGQNVAASASVNATTADIGKGFVINGAGSGSAPLVTTVTGISGTSWLLGTNASTTVSSGGSAFYATDDGGALAAAAQAMQTYALAHDYKAQLILGAKLYGASTLFQQGTGPLYNTHLPVLYPNVNGSTQKLIFEIIGAGAAGQCQFWEATVPNIQGSAIVSMSQAPSSPNGTYGQQSIIGGPTGGGAFTGGFANTHVHTEGITVASPAFPNQIGMDFAFLGGWSFRNCGADVIQTVNGNSPALPSMPGSGGFQSSIGVGFRAPLLGNNDAVTGSRLAVEGYETGLWVADHFTVDGLATIYMDLAVLYDQTHSPAGNNALPVTIANWSCENYNGAFKANGGSGAAGQIDILVQTQTSGNVNPTYDLSDSANILTGVFRWADPFRTSGVPVLSGGANVEVISARQARAVQSAPTYTLGTAFQNPWWRHMWISLSGGTVSGITIGPTSAAATTSVAASTPATFRLPSGWWLNIAGSVKPTTFTAVPD